MTNPVVDKVAAAMFNNTHGLSYWDEISSDDRDLYRALAQAGMDAALPAFAQWLRDAGYLAEPYAQDDTVSGNPQALVARWLQVETRKEPNTYAKLNALSGVYRKVELRVVDVDVDEITCEVLQGGPVSVGEVLGVLGDKAHLVPAPERADGARRDRGRFDIAGLIPCPEEET